MLNNIIYNHIRKDLFKATKIKKVVYYSMFKGGFKMSTVKLNLKNIGTIDIKEGTTAFEIVKEYYSYVDIPIVLAKVNNDYVELREPIEKEGNFEPITIEDTIGNRTYSRTVQFIFIKAVYDLFKDCKVVIEHSLDKGIYGEIHKEKALDQEDIKAINRRMQEIIDADIIIEKSRVDVDKAIDIFDDYGLEDKKRLLRNINKKDVTLYNIQGRYDYFFGFLAHSTGAIKNFQVMFYDPGFLIRFPREENPRNILPFVEHKKLNSIFKETEEWLDILNVADVGALNEKILNGNANELIMVTEALHEKKIANIADMIKEKNEVKVVLIAGPSSSGKTTFANRLSVQLRVNGLIPIAISLDDYFVDRDKSPRDENGELDFESIYALDLELFNKDLVMLMEGKEVEIPTYNFKSGTRQWLGHKIKLPQNGVLVIEGIHGLNNMLTSSIQSKNKFKIYISALTQLNLDSHNRIATTDVRRIRRIVRDFLSRGYGGETTLNMWPSIRRGEEKNIFIFQEEADIMFNSTLVYELCILKKYALEELKKISPTSSAYYEATRLISFLNLFKDIDKELVPSNSILREFIGGSIFYKY